MKSAEATAFTLWRKWMLFNCDGFTVLNTTGGLVFLTVRCCHAGFLRHSRVRRSYRNRGRLITSRLALTSSRDMSFYNKRRNAMATKTS